MRMCATIAISSTRHEMNVCAHSRLSASLSPRTYSSSSWEPAAANMPGRRLTTVSASCRNHTTNCQ